jgi:hypothetical protein
VKATRDEKTGKWTLEGVEHDAITYRTICQNIEDKIPFKFARYGDGEINCMNGKRGHNCDMHEYFPDMGVRLIESISVEPDYMVGIQPLSVEHLGASVQNYFGGFDLYNADVLHNASIESRMTRFIQALENRYVILVGPPHLANLFDEMVHIVISPLNAWLDYESIRAELDFQLDSAPDPVVLLCCGMMAEVLIHDFCEETITMIDTGSVFDPYMGVKSRKYHHKL